MAAEWQWEPRRPPPRRRRESRRDSNVIGNFGDIGNVDHLRDAADLGHVRNVRLRLKQHCFVFDANIDVADGAGRRRSNRNSVGIYRDRQSWGQLRSSGTDAKSSSPSVGVRGADYGRTNPALSYRLPLVHLRPQALSMVPIVAGVVAQHDVPIYLTGVGTVIAYNTVVVRSQIQGQIVSINFTEGQAVHAGDLLAQIDPRPYQAQIDQYTANRDRDQAQLMNALANLNRYTPLESKGLRHAAAG